MNVKELIDRLQDFDPKMEIRIKPKGILTGTEVIEDVRVTEYNCPRICVLIEGC